ncbi:glycoside hydrolase family 5 protein [Actinomadura sp. NPDC047616]|uniref:glycoside hydrolase family 5 protein n=1 Tax=Actinomadura sp. NPDC047616 TaxID=3155914 RepID=UPI0033C8D2B1
MRGINFGNVLDHLGDDSPRLLLRDEHFDAVRAAGFDTVRLPARWSAHAGHAAPHTIEPGFFRRVDQAVDAALRRGFTVVLNVHHYHELQEAPQEHATRFVALWRQIAEHYAGHDARLLFELLNEPRDALTARLWNELLRDGLAAVRAHDRERTVIVGSARMNDVGALPELALPAEEHLMATVHYYAPFEFTHQGAPWVPGAARWLGTTWGDDADRQRVRDDLAKAARWAAEQGVSLFIGEFGAYMEADEESRVRWTSFVRAEAERLGSGWCYWDFGTDFGAFDPRSGAWREPLLRALLPS